VEDRRPDVGALQQSGLPRAEVAARRLPELWHLQPAHGRFNLNLPDDTRVSMTDTQ